MKLRLTKLIALLAIALLPATLQAVNFNWVAGIANWEDPANWDTGTVPTGGGGNFAFVNNGGTAIINATTNSIQDTIVARGVGTSGTVSLLNGTHTNSGWTIVGDQGTGTFNQSGGNQVTGDMLLGIVGGTGNYNITGSGSATVGRFAIGGHRDVGTGGTGQMTVDTTGTVTSTSDLWVGTRGANATLNVISGTVNANTWFMVGETHNGGASTGVVNQSGGVVSNGVADANGRFWIGTQEGGATATSSGTYNLSGGTLNARNVSIGRHYIGIFNQTGGTANFTQGADETTFATQPGSSATYTMSAGNANFIGVAQIGARGNATMTVTGGTVNANGWTGIGRFAGGVGHLNVSGGTFTHNGDSTSIIIGEEGTGTLTISGTGVVTENSTNGLRIAHGVGGNGTLNLNAGGTLAAHFIQKTNVAGTAVVNLNGGTLRALSNNANYFVGLTAGEIPILAGGLVFDSNGSSVVITQDLAGSGGLTKIGAGTLSITGTPTYLGATTVDGGTLSMGNGGLTGTISGPVTVNAGGTFGFNRSDDIIDSRVFSGTGSVAQNGTGTLTLNGTYDTFMGAIQANAGRLVASGTFGGNVNANSGGRISTAAGAVGTITAAGVTIGDGSTLDFDFSAGGATFDQIVSTGGITFGSAFTLNLFQEGTASPFSDNGTYAIFDYATSVTGSPSGFTVGNPVLGKSYQLADNAGTTQVRLTIADAVLVHWNVDGSGLWSTNTNWLPSITPNIPTAEVTFGSVITAPVTVSLDGDKTSGKLTFDNLNSYTVSGTDTLTLDNGLAAATITVLQGSHIIAVPVTLPNSTTVSTAAGTALQLGDLSGSQALTKVGGGTLTFNGDLSTTGSFILTDGIVQVGNGGATGSLPSGPVSLAANTRISFNKSSSTTVANTITGAGSISQDGTGTVTHTGNSSYTGFTDLNAGTFNNVGTISGTSNIDVNNITNLQTGSTTSTSGTINVGPGGTLTSAGTASHAGNVNVNDGGTLNITGGTFTQTVNADNTGFWIANTGTSTLNVSGGIVSNYETRVGVLAGSVGTFNLSGGRVDTNHWTIIGEGSGSTGHVEHTGGTWNQNHTDWISIGQYGTGSYTMSGNAVLNDQAVVDTSVRGTNKGNVVVGRWNNGTTAGNGTWTLEDNASARIRRLQIADQAGTIGVVNVTENSSVTLSEDIHIGQAGTGTINLSGGNITTVSGWTQVGVAAGGMGTLNISGGSMTQREVRIGVAGTGIVHVSGGTLNATQPVTLGVNATGNGTLLVTDTGTVNLSTDLRLAPNATGLGTLAVTGGTIQQTAGITFIGDNGLGQAAFIGGTSNFRQIIVADGPGTSDSYLNIAGTAVVNSVGGPFILGNGALATSSITGGTLNVASELWIGQAAGGNGSMNMSAGTVNATGWIAIGRQGANGMLTLSGGNLLKTGDNTTHIILGSLAGTGTLNQSGGNINTVGFGEIRLGENPGGSGTWNMNNGTATTDGISVGWVNGGTGSLTIGGTASISTGSLRIAEGGTGTVTQTGGTITVSGTLSGQGAATGTYHLSGGRLNVDGTAILNGTFNFTGGTISRSTPGILDIDGNLFPAASAATIKLDHDKTFDIAGTLTVGGLTLDVTGRGIPDGVFTGTPITGSIPLGIVTGGVFPTGSAPGGNAFDIPFTDLLGFDSTFDLAGVGTLMATRINEDAPFNPLTDSVYWVDEDSGAVSIQYSVIPEPSAIAFLLGGIALLARRRRS